MKDSASMEGDDTDFVTVAVRHGLLQDSQVDDIVSHVRQNDVNPSDAALTLSILQLHEVDAIQLLRQPDKLAPGYHLTQLLGCGAGGMVFRARQTALGRDVALKTINQNASNAKTTGQSRIQREAHAIARLRHPGIVAAIDSGFYQGRFCIAMELVEGENLACFIDREAPIAEHTVWCIARQAAAALSHAASSGIIHRDVKPANLLLCKPPSGMRLPPGVPFVKVADFGLAFESSGSDANQLTQPGMTLGTPAYVAPEQLDNTHVDARADIYSLGATVFHMLTGSAPCSDQTPMRTIMQKTIGDDRWRDLLPKTISAGTAELFRDMTHADLDDRLADYDTLIERIDQLLDPKTELGNPDLSSVSKSKIQDIRKSRIKRFPEALLAGLVLVFVVGVLVSFLLTGISTTGVPAGPEVQWRVDGFPQPLFNGESVPLFRQFGSWTASVVDDGSRVLTGTQGSTMTIPLQLGQTATQAPVQEQTQKGDARLRLGIHLPQNGVVELDMVDGSASPQMIATLRLGNGKASWIPGGLPSNSQDELSADWVDASVGLLEPQSGDVIFQRVSVSQQADRCVVSVNGEDFPPLRCDQEKLSGVRLRCVQGSVYFGDLDIVAIKRDTAVDQAPRG